MPGAEQWGWGCSHHHRAPAPHAPLVLHGNKCTAWDLEQLQVLVLAAQPLPWWVQSSINAPPSQESPCSLSLLMEATAPGCRLNEKGFVGQLVREAAGEAAKLLGFEWPSGFYIIIQMLP